MPKGRGTGCIPEPVIFGAYQNPFTMNMKVLLAALVGGVVAFLMGWLIWGIGLMGYYEANMIHYDGLMKSEEEFNLVLMFLGNLVLSTLMAILFHRMGVASLMGGAMTGALIGSLFFLHVDLGFLAMMNYFATPMLVVVDVLANAVWGAGIGAVIGLMLGRGKAVASN